MDNAFQIMLQISLSKMNLDLDTFCIRTLMTVQRNAVHANINMV